MAAIIATCDKQLLPSYDVFDEKRYFESGESSCMFDCEGQTIGVSICEDFWLEGLMLMQHQHTISIRLKN